MSLPRVTYQSVYQGHPIQASPELGLGCREDILGKGLSIIEHAVGEHVRVFFMRLDFRYPKGGDHASRGNLFQGFLASFTNYLKRHGYAPLNLWVREQADSPVPHYHVALMLDGIQTSSARGHLEKAVELWGTVLDIEDAKGLVHLCPTMVNGKAQDGVMVERGAADYQAMFDHCFHWLSYMAKETSKGDAPWHHREFGGSQVPRR